MGFFDLLNPVFAVIDSYALGWAPAWLIVSIYGLVSGVITMLVYARVSNQEALSRGKIESKEALAEMKALDPDAEPDVVMATMKRAISAPLNQAKNSLLPALAASVPLIFIMVWISQTYSYDTPEAGSLIPVQVNPDTSLLESNGIQAVEDGYQMVWPSSGELELMDEGGAIVAAIPSSLSIGILHKHQWWNALFSNPAGYLDDSSPVDSVTLSLPNIELVGFGPDWLRTWWFFYFLVLMSAAIGIKVKFKIT